MDVVGDGRRVIDGAGVGWYDAAVVEASLQPNHPGVSQVVLGAVPVGEEDGYGEVAVVIVVVSSRQPNHPGVLQVVVVSVVVVEVVVVVAVVVSSRQPHQPGVLQVDVLVVIVVVGKEVVVVVVESEPLLLKNFQSSQSKHSSSGAQGATFS